jgi:LysM repeat protein
MAMDYEVRSDYKDMPLSDLLGATVMSFQGVGDTQHEILNKFFTVESVEQLANFPFFLSALGIQELALRRETNGQRPVREIETGEALKFAVRDEYKNLSAKDLLASPVRVLDGLAPAQALALYDAFRITNVIQLAQNRIMLEARIIEYLDKVGSGQIPEGDMNAQIASILLSDGLPDVDEARRRMAEGQGEGDLGSMASGLAVHLRERLEALRNRAKDKAGEIAGKPKATADELAEDAGRVRPGVKLDSRGRTDAIRESRQRADAAIGTSTGGRPSREAAASLIAQRDTARGAGTRTIDTAAVAGRTISRPSTTRYSSGGTSTSSTVSATPRPSAVPQRQQAEAAAEEARVKQAAAAAEAQERRREAAQRAANMRLLLVAAAVVVLLAGGIGVWLSLREPPVQMTASQPQGQGAAGTQPGAGAPSADTQTQSAVQPAPAAVVEPPPIPIRATHTVTRGQSLWRISRRYYENPELWPNIFRANEQSIDDPDLIYPRQKVKIPEVESKRPR